jgi:uncharacterized protein with GYD domain
MPLFITYASYSPSGAKGLVDKPSDRSAVIKALVEKAGAKYIANVLYHGLKRCGAHHRGT